MKNKKQCHGWYRVWAFLSCLSSWVEMLTSPSHHLSHPERCSLLLYILYRWQLPIIPTVMLKNEKKKSETISSWQSKIVLKDKQNRQRNTLQPQQPHIGTILQHWRKSVSWIIELETASIALWKRYLTYLTSWSALEGIYCHRKKMEYNEGHIIVKKPLDVFNNEDYWLKPIYCVR